ncbi:hypothetical protein B0H19DRAFT_1184174, partial [Mycena capillaripes]
RTQGPASSGTELCGLNAAHGHHEQRVPGNRPREPPPRGASSPGGRAGLGGRSRARGRPRRLEYRRGVALPVVSDAAHARPRLHTPRRAVRMVCGDVDDGLALGWVHDVSPRPGHACFCFACRFKDGSSSRGHSSASACPTPRHPGLHHHTQGSFQRKRRPPSRAPQHAPAWRLPGLRLELEPSDPAQRPPCRNKPTHDSESDLHPAGRKHYSPSLDAEPEVCVRQRRRGHGPGEVNVNWVGHGLNLLY